MNIFDLLFIIGLVVITIWIIRDYIRCINCINAFYDAEERLLRFIHEHPSISRDHPIYEKHLREIELAKKEYMKLKYR
jgi:hypothetical protein